MGCLAAQVVAHFKEEPGRFYLYPAGTRNCGEEYIYTLYDGNSLAVGNSTSVMLKVEECHEEEVLFDGPIADFSTEDD